MATGDCLKESQECDTSNTSVDELECDTSSTSVDELECGTSSTRVEELECDAIYTSVDELIDFDRLLNCNQFLLHHGILADVRFALASFFD